MRQAKQKNSSGDEFGAVLEIIRVHRANALVSVNVEHLLTNWEIGGYLSAKIKHDGWGKSTIDSLVDYIHTHAPDERGYGRSSLYSMVAVYDEFTSPDFTALVARYGDLIVQSATGQLADGRVVQPSAELFPVSDLTTVQSPTGQIAPMPSVLALTTFTNIVEILNRARSAQERLFYIVYAFREKLKLRELRACLVNDTYSSLLGGDKKNFSTALVASYPDSPVLFRDSALWRF